MSNKKLPLDRKDDFSAMFFVVLASIFLTATAYFLLSSIFYTRLPEAYGGGEVFFVPRHAPGVNDFPTGVFNSWEIFLRYSFIICLIFFGAYYFVYKKIHNLFGFLLNMYFLALLTELMFLGYTANGFGHIELQTQSVNNGIWHSVNYLLRTPEFLHASNLNKLVYFFHTLCGNESGTSIYGTTHPPGSFVIAFIVYRIASSLFINAAFGWGLVVTILNTFIIVIVALMANFALSQRIGKLTAIMLITIPSVTMHFCALMDGIATLFTAIGFLAIILVIKNLYSLNESSRTKFLLLGAMTGLAFTLAAQMTYGHAIPIMGALFSFSLVVFKRINKLKFYIVGLCIFPALYFIFEYFISSGTSFYPVRAMRVVKLVTDGLFMRPYPLSQFGNFTVMSIMGGILYFPTIINSFQFIRESMPFFFIKKEEKADLSINYRRKVRTFLSLTSISILFFLLIQKTVRLEVERTWHWAFIPVWSLMGIYFVVLKVVFRRLFPKGKLRIPPVLILGVIQLIISIALALCVQDYY